jgi:hypothetical protein
MVADIFTDIRPTKVALEEGFAQLNIDVLVMNSRTVGEIIIYFTQPRNSTVGINHKKVIEYSARYWQPLGTKLMVFLAERLDDE